MTDDLEQMKPSIITPVKQVDKPIQQVHEITHAPIASNDIKETVEIYGIQ